jgi:parallel beta-helix repeat protein
MSKPRPFRPRADLLEAREVPAALFVSTTGSDANPGTLDRPWRTLQHAVNQAAPGDEVVLRGGTYADGMVRVNTPNLTVRSMDGEWATVSAPTHNTAHGMTLWLQPRADNFTLRRVEVTGGYYYGIKTETTDGTGRGDATTGLRIEDSKIHDTGRDAIKLVPGSDDATILRSTIYNTGRRDSSNAEGIDNVNADRMVVRDSHFYNIATTGIYPKGGATDCVIEGNLIRNAGGGGVMVGFYTDAEWFDPTANPDYHESIRTVVRNNIIVGTGYAGIGMYASKDSVVANNTLVDVARTSQAAVLFDRVGHWVGGRTVYQTNVNPTVVNNVVSVSTVASRPVVEVRLGGLAAGTLTIGNNLYHRPSAAGVFRDLNVRGATYSGGFAGWQTRMRDAGSREANPMLDAGYHLRAGSPAIDAGRPVAGLARDYDGNPRTGTPDIGADEFGAGATLRTPPPASVIGTGGAGGDAAPPPGGNTAPTISAVPDQTVVAGRTTGPIGFTVSDAETPAGELEVLATSSNRVLVPADRVVLGGSGGSRTVTVTPVDGRTGVTTITLTVTDGGGLTATRTFTVTVTPGPGSAVFVGTDTTTRGSWRGTYGSAGAVLATASSRLPAGATLTPAGKYNAVWAQNSTDVRALEVPGATGRLAAGWFSYGSFTVALDLGAGPPRRVSLYLLDWDRQGRAERIEVRETASGRLLDERTVSDFGGGKYLSWTVSGAVTFRIVRTAGPNAAVSGFFFD